MSTQTVDHIWSLIKPIKVGMLQTIENESINARPMHNIQDDFEGSLWFFTQADSGKNKEIANHQLVSVSYADADKGNFVHLNGKAYIVKDRSKIDQYWNQFVSLWFPEGKESSNVSLIRIDVHHIEYWESHNKLSQVFEMAKAKMTNERPDLGTNETVSLP